MAKYDWEKRVIDIFLNQEHFDDEPPEYYEYYNAEGKYEERKEYDSDYEDPYADEMEDERKLARQERASSRCNRY
jgi:hypothetical protein